MGPATGVVSFHLPPKATLPEAGGFLRSWEKLAAAREPKAITMGDANGVSGGQKCKEESRAIHDSPRIHVAGMDGGQRLFHARPPQATSPATRDTGPGDWIMCGQKYFRRTDSGSVQPARRVAISDVLVETSPDTAESKAGSHGPRQLKGPQQAEHAPRRPCQCQLCHN